MSVVVGLAWLGLSIFLAWVTTKDMPAGYGTAMFLTVFVAAFPSTHFIAHGLPSWIDPSTKVVVRGGPGRPNRLTTFARSKGRRWTLIGIAVLAVALLGGWLLERAMGLPERHVREAVMAAQIWQKQPDQAVARCLAGVPRAQAESCPLTYRVSVRGARAVLELASNGCHHPGIRACVQQHLGRAELDMSARQLDSIDYAGGTTITVDSPQLAGTAVVPAERLEP